MWISQENEDQGWSQNPQSQTANQEKATVCVRKKFPKSARILKRPHFLSLMRGKCRFYGNEVSIEYRQRGKARLPQLGITVSRRYGKAHERNRFKRVVREAFRGIYTTLPVDLELNISPKNKHSSISTIAILLDLKKLLAFIRK